jgi:CheY-like chemotaxis protein
MAVVMVVDDDPEACSTLKTFLSRRGHRVNCAKQGKEAIDLMTSDPADVVVLDAVMPLVDGVQFLEVLRCYLRWQQIPVILLTAYREGPHIKRALELGLRKTFLKGDYDLEELGAFVDTLAPGGPALAEGLVQLPYHDQQ